MNKQLEKPNHIGIVLNATANEFKGVTDRKSYDEIAKRVAKEKGYLITAEYMDGYEIIDEYRTLRAARAALPNIKRHIGRMVKGMKYDVPILSRAHAEFCKQEAELRYGGKIVTSKDGMVMVKDANGFCHTDAVLRALSNDYRRGRITP